MSHSSFGLISVVFLAVTTLFAAISSFPTAFHENDSAALKQPKRRPARSVIQFGRMIECLTLRSAYDYVDYGCWCGIGGQGTPVDALDRCCYVHDKCYDKAMEICDSVWQVYFRSYRYRGCGTCEPLTAYPRSEGRNANCKTFLCECDSAAARCFSQSQYNSSFANYDSANCKWKGK